MNKFNKLYNSIIREANENKDQVMLSAAIQNVKKTMIRGGWLQDFNFRKEDPFSFYLAYENHGLKNLLHGSIIIKMNMNLETNIPHVNIYDIGATAPQLDLDLIRYDFITDTDGSGFVKKLIEMLSSQKKAKFYVTALTETLERL